MRLEWATRPLRTMLEGVPPADLDAPAQGGAAGKRRDHAGIRLADDGVGIKKLRVVEHVSGVSPQFQLLALNDVESLTQRNIRLEQAGTGGCIPWSTPGGRRGVLGGGGK